MSCCSITKARRKLQSNIERNIVDPVKAEAGRIESKTRNELKRVPNNLDKGLSSAQAKVGSAISGVTGALGGFIPGLKGVSTFVKFMAIGAVVLVGLAILRRATK